MIQLNIKQPLALLVLAGVLICLPANAQDTIYTNSDSPLILAKILEVNPTNMKYKSYSNLDGPTYTIELSTVEKVIYRNGDIDKHINKYSENKELKRQPSEVLLPGSRIFLTFSRTKDKSDVDGNDALQMLKSYMEGKTSCVIVNTIDEADFEMELRVIKKIMAERKAMLTIRHLLTDKEVYRTKWVRGTSNAFSGYSGSRHSIGKLIKKYVVKDYPEIGI